MDILCIAKQLTDAQSATAALRDVAPNLKVLWTSRFDHAAVWIDEHRDLAALLVDAEVDDQGCAPFLTHVRRKGINAPAVVITPEGSLASVESLHAGADDCAVKNQSLPHELRAAVGRSIARARTLGASRWDHLRGDTPRPSMKDAQATELAKRQAEFETKLAEATRSRAVVEELLQQERATRASLEGELGQAKAALQDAEATLRDAHERHSLALDAITRELADGRSQFEAELSQSGATCERLKEQLRDRHASTAAEVARLTSARNSLEGDLVAARLATQEAIDRGTRERIAAASKAAERESNLDARIRQECAARASAEQKLTLLERALRDAEERHSSAAAAAAVALEELQTRFDIESAQGTAARETLTRQLLDAEVALEDLRRQHSATVTEIERLTERQATLVSQLHESEADRTALDRRLAEAAAALEDADTRANGERLLAAERQADLEARLAQEVTNREGLEREIAGIRTAAEAAERQFAIDGADFANQLAELQEILDRTRELAEADVCTLAAERTVAQHELDQARRSFQETLDRVSGEHSRELAALVAAVAEREAHIADQATLHSASLESAADDCARLQRELNERRAEILRLFEESPLAMCRCTRDGALTHANRALALLTGHETVDDLRSADFGAAVFESPNDLPWLIDRCVGSTATESIETIWKTKDGARLTVRVSASALARDVIDIIAEDLTNLRAVQERLGQAQRMEAVGRLASEVGVTCVNLLSDVRQDGERWLKTLGPDPSLRHQGEMLLDEVTRATGFLRKLAAYGDEQTSALAPVDLNRVLRDLGPVLKRVAGDEVEIELPRTTTTLTIDVEAERVERLLVNLASYGRERMPFGGQLKIEVATVVVDQKFIEKYPNVRVGPHALVTVTEARRTARVEGPLRLREWPAETRNDVGPSERLGVDLGALQGLIRESGGHLWMIAAPAGDMVVQIHLPLRQSDERTQQRPLTRRAS